jgi:hypothetical protein
VSTALTITNMVSVFSIDDLLNGFPTPVLPKYNRSPPVLTSSKQLVCSMTKKQQWILFQEGARHGYLGIIMTNVEYALLSPTLLACPIDPGPLPNVQIGMESVEANQ